MPPDRLLLRGGRVLCPGTETDIVADVLIEDGRIVRVGDGATAGAQIVDCDGCIVAPGFVDLGAELCDPGYTWREDLGTGSEAAAAGGFTTVLASPNTDPVVDNPTVAADVIQRASQVSGARVVQAGSLTVGMKGEALAEIGLMIEAGCPAISDGRNPIMDTGILRRALDYARPFGAPILLRPGDSTLEGSGVMHEGDVSMRVGLRGISGAAEEIAVGRAIALARVTGARIHLTQVTMKQSVALLRSAHAEGIAITGAVPGRHLILTDEAVETSVYDTSTRLLPPLRSDADRQACVEGVKDGTLCITADHVPHTRIEKELEYMFAVPGASGLETAAAAALSGLDGDVAALVRGLSCAPATILGLNGTITVGSPADLVVMREDKDIRIEGPFRSLGVSDPMVGSVAGLQITATIVGGRVVYGPQAP